MAIDLADVMDAADVGMRDDSRRADFTAKTVEPRCVARELGRQELEGHGLAKREIVRPVHLAHTAASQQRDDSVTTGDRFTWRESSAIEDGMRGEPAGQR